MIYSKYDKTVLRFKDIVDSPCGIRHSFESLGLSSGFSRKYLLESRMMYSPEEIRSAYLSLQSAVRITSSPKTYSSLVAALCDLRDITPTLLRLGCGETMDDIELFELKHLGLMCMRVKEVLETSIPEGCLHDIPCPDDLTAAVDILDPERTRVPSFHVYDAYNSELASLRRKARGASDQEKVLLLDAAAGLEKAVRESLSVSLRSHVGHFRQSLSALAELDIIMAKAKQMEDNGYVIPKILEKGCRSSYEGVVHPYVASIVEASGNGHFQPVDISLSGGPTLLIGMNMGGKSVALKMTALVQYLAQFGFSIPAESASVSPKEMIFFVSGDAEHTERGLSSFAGEIEAVSNVIAAARQGRDILALIDEPARTTNPTEGAALVAALVTTLSDMNVTALITTHYDLPTVKCRLLRVKGYEDGKMDYSLVEASAGSVPHEAIDTALRLGADKGWIDLARRLVDNR